jgi:ankyrin repeat protein
MTPLDEIDSVDKHGRTVLYLAAMGGHAQIVERLLENGFKSSVQSFEGVSILNAACQRGHSEVVVLLARHSGKGIVGQTQPQPWIPL